jgi:hypothetical protein
VTEEANSSCCCYCCCCCRSSFSIFPACLLCLSGWYILMELQQVDWRELLHPELSLHSLQNSLSLSLSLSLYLESLNKAKSQTKCKELQTGIPCYQHATLGFWEIAGTKRNLNPKP